MLTIHLCIQIQKKCTAFVEENAIKTEVKRNQSRSIMQVKCEQNASKVKTMCKKLLVTCWKSNLILH